MRDTFFVSDMHFGHNNIIKYCNRPYTNVETMDDALVQNWNHIVGPHDTVYHLGDWAFHNYERIGELRGRIISIPGNHDQEREKKILPFLANGFTEEIHYLKINKELRFVLCHYPLETWNRHFKFHLHGHTHGMTGDGYSGYRGNIPNRLDVGIDAIKLYRPIHLEEVLELIERGYLETL